MLLLSLATDQYAYLENQRSVTLSHPRRQGAPALLRYSRKGTRSEPAAGEMMEYMINGINRYRPSDGTLYAPEYHLDMITLPRVANELLLLLVAHVHKPLSREFLLYELWERQGLNASSNNLNNYVSMLRKALIQTGCTDVIRTIPKYGFVFEAEVVTTDPDEVTPSPVIESIKVAKSKSELPSGKPFIGCLATTTGLFLLLFVIFIPELWNGWNLMNHREEFTRIGSCRFYTANDDTRLIGREQAIARVKELVQAEKIDCKKNANIYYFSENKFDSQGLEMADELLSYCPYGSLAPCVNYSYIKRQNEN